MHELPHPYIEINFFTFWSDENGAGSYVYLSKRILVKGTIITEGEYTLRFPFIPLFTIGICELLLQLQVFKLNVKLSAKISLVSCQLSLLMKYIIFSTAKSPIADMQPSENVFHGWKA